MTNQTRHTSKHPWDASAREPYLLPQPEGLVSLRDFLFTTAEGQRCVLLRWNLDAEFPVEAFTVKIEELDPVGEVLETVTVVYRGEDIPDIRRGESFTPERGVAVHGRCTDIRICLTELRSEGYVYTVSKGRIVQDFCPEEKWLYREQGGSEDGLSDEISLRVISKAGLRPRHLWPAALLSLLLLILFIIYPCLPHDREGELKAYSESADILVLTEDTV